MPVPGEPIANPESLGVHAIRIRVDRPEAAWLLAWAAAVILWVFRKSCG